MAFAQGCGGGGGGNTEDATSPSEEDIDSGLDAGEDEPIEDLDAEIDAETPEPDIDADTPDACEAKSCKQLGYECGNPTDGCGGPLSCGTCMAGLTCGGGGEEFKCGCTPLTCEQLSSERGAKACGMIADGCGNMLDCGNPCTGTETCGGAVPNQCGCTPNLAACVGKECGTASDGCGNTVQCGANAGMCSAMRECTAQQTCACRAAEQVCNGRCGTIIEDGCTFDCGVCEGTCASQAACGNCQCPAGSDPASTADDEICRAGTCCKPEPVATTCGTAQCGTKVNNCGQTVTCGTCGSGATPYCVQSRCVDSKLNALVGTYALRNVGFAFVGTIASRTEGYSLVDIFLNAAGQPVFREQSCATVTYARIGSQESEAARVDAATSTKVAPVDIVLQVPGPESLPGSREWFKEKAAYPNNTLGWRRGRPTYCPAPTAGNPMPSPDPAHPDYNPTPDADPFARRARKPWLNGGTCRCPEAEFAAHPPCQGLTGAKLTACMADPINLSLPFQPGEASLDVNVTDCRVMDEDQDLKPAMTATATIPAGLGSATIRSAAVSAVRFWGDIDESGAKLHKGVSQDQPELQNASVACVDPVLLGRTLCSASSTSGLCNGYVNGVRSNPVDMVPLPTRLTCQQIWDTRGSLFPAATFPNHSDKYPMTSDCPTPP